MRNNTLLIFTVALALLLINLGKPDIYILDEAKNAECAREMLVSGDYIVPYFNGQMRTDKPPLHYFFMAASYKIFGVSAFSARFFSAVFGALTIALVFAFCRRFFARPVAWLSALALLASLHFNFQMRLAVPDPYLIFFMTGTLMCFYLFLSSGRSSWLWLMYIGFGLGALTKGPVAIGLPGLAMFIYLLGTRRLNWKTIRSFRIIAGILIVCIVALPWYVLNYQATGGEWTEKFFFKHNLNRYSDTMEGHGGFFLLPLIMVIAGLLPLGIYALPAAIGAWLKRRNPLLWFCLVIVLTIVIFFSFSGTILPNYTAPAYPFAAILVGYYLAKFPRGAWFRTMTWIFALIAIALPLGVYYGLKADAGYSELSGLWVWFAALPAGALAALYWLHSGQPRKTIIAAALSFMITNTLFFAFAYPRAYERNPVNVSLSLLHGKKDIAYYKMMNSAYVFQLQRIIPMLGSEQELKAYLEQHPGASIITRKQFQPEIETATGLQPVFEQQDVFERPVTMIFQ